MASGARRSRPRPPARRGGAEFRRALRLPPLVNGYGLEFQSPVNGFHSRNKRPEITIVPRASVELTVDIQIEWRTTKAYQAGSYPVPSDPWLPTPTYTTTVTGLSRDTPTVVNPPTDLSYTSWWYRARAGKDATGTWSSWSDQKWLDVYPIVGSTTEYMEMNVGVVMPDRLDQVAAYIEMNVGIEPSPEWILSQYIAMNVGVESRLKLAAEYMPLNIYPPPGEFQAGAYTDLNVVTDETPTPHIWWIRPEQGKEGYVFNIFGHGFGSSSGEFDGKVRLGNLVCAFSRWERVLAQVRPSTVKVSGRTRTTSSTTDMPYVLLNSNSIVVQAGDIIEYDMMWEEPSLSRLDIFPSFDISGTSTDMGYGSGLLNDTTGDAWISDQPEAYGAWWHRRFVVPPEHYLVGKTISNFRVQWYGFSALAPLRAGSIRSFVVRRADDTVLLWVTGDDQSSTPALTYTANSGTLVSATFQQEGHVIERGLALNSDTITPEHGWIVAIVPSGAVSSMVRVVLEDD